MKSGSTYFVTFSPVSPKGKTVPIGPVKVPMLGTHFRSMSIPLILVSTYVYYVLDFGIAWLRFGNSSSSAKVLWTKSGSV